MKQYARKKKFVDAEVQGALTKRLTLHWALYISLSAVLIVGLKWLNNPFSPLSDHLAEAWITYGSVLVVLLSLAPMFIFDTIKLSNRFAGPVLRIRNAARQLAAGKTPEKIKLRDDDFWKNLAEEFNSVIDRVESQANSNRDESLAVSSPVVAEVKEDEFLCESI